MRFTLFLLLAVAIVIGAVVLLSTVPEAELLEDVVYEPLPELMPLKEDVDFVKEAQEEGLGDEIPESVLHAVPFTSQAPGGQWGNARYQDACEEASVYMAALYIKGDERDSVPPTEAADDLLRLSKLSEELFGTFVDTSAEDTAWLLASEAPLAKYELVESPTIESMKEALALDAVIIAPMDGRLLGNPYFTEPGPERHMVLVIGYDDATQEFITNDPGTKRGAKFRYEYETFTAAMRDYPTGNVLPIKELYKRAIFVYPPGAVTGLNKDIDSESGEETKSKEEPFVDMPTSS